MAPLAELKDRACREVDRLAGELSELGRNIHANPEVAAPGWQGRSPGAEWMS